MPVLEFQNVSYSYPQSEKKALKNVSFSVDSGDYVALLGANGSGKSTASRIMAGFIQPEEGELKIDDDVLPGIVFQQPKEQIVAGIVERDTAFGPQNLNLSKSEIELRTIECLSVVGLADRASSRTFELSLGQTQRLAFSGILALFPDFLILDEVTAMLDPAARLELIKFIDQWNARGHTIVHVTHDRDEALRAKRIIVLEKGEVRFNGTRDEFIKTPGLSENVFGRGIYSVCRERNAAGSENASGAVAVSGAQTADGGAKNVSGSQTSSGSGQLSGAQKKLSLSVEHLSFSYEERTVFSDLSFKAYSGELIALTGPSGCGKSTLFECLAGLHETGGKIFCTTRPSLALQESDAALFAPYAADDVAFGPKNLGVEGKELVRRVKHSMELAGLSYKDFADRSTFALSGGEKRKLSLAGIIALDSDVMLFDEPTSALDSASRETVLNTLRQLADSGKTVIFSTHRTEEALLADRELVWDELNAGAEDASELRKCDGAIEDVAGTENAVGVQKNAVGSEESLPLMTPHKNISFLKSITRIGASVMAPAKIPRSPVSMLPAAVKFLLLLVLLISAMVVRPLYLSAVMLGVSLLYVLLAKCPLKRIFYTLWKLLPWILIFAVLEFILYPVKGTDIILWQWKIFAVTDTKLLLALRMMIRASSFISILTTFIFSTSEREILDGLAALIPIRYVVLVVGIIFRFIPLLMDETAGIIKTQMVRGAFGSARGFKKIKVLVSLFVPLVLESFRKAQCLADALTARYFS